MIAHRLLGLLHAAQRDSCRAPRFLTWHPALHVFFGHHFQMSLKFFVQLCIHLPLGKQLSNSPDYHP
jgi:hypothetical protein